MAKMKKIFVPIAIVFAVLAVMIFALAAVAGIKGNKKVAANAVSYDEIEEGSYYYGLMVSLSDYSVDNGYFTGVGYTDDDFSPSDDYDYYNDYILPNSDSIRLTEEDLEGLSAQELTYARNEIYARHGYVFESEELREYFSVKDWYYPDSSVDVSFLSQLELDNADFIRNYQRDNGLEYTPQ